MEIIYFFTPNFGYLYFILLNIFISAILFFLYCFPLFYFLRAKYQVSFFI